MSQVWQKIILAVAAMPLSSVAYASVDSYRFAHVTIATPWYIFIFLMGGVFAPFVLIAVLAWRNAMRKAEQDASTPVQESGEK